MKINEFCQYSMDSGPKNVSKNEKNLQKIQELFSYCFRRLFQALVALSNVVPKPEKTFGP